MLTFYTLRIPPTLSLFFFNDTATTEIYTLSLHDALPISFISAGYISLCWPAAEGKRQAPHRRAAAKPARSEEHTSELQSRLHLVCRLLLEKKKKKNLQGVKQYHH